MTREIASNSFSEFALRVAEAVLAGEQVKIDGDARGTYRAHATSAEGGDGGC